MTRGLQTIYPIPPLLFIIVGSVSVSMHLNSGVVAQMVEYIWTFLLHNPYSTTTLI